MSTRMARFPMLLLALIFLAALALTGFNLSTALPRDQWATAFAAPDIDNIQQMLFHYSLLPRLAISCWSGRDWDWWAYCFSRCCVTRWQSRPRWAWRRGLSWGSPSLLSGPCRER
ncbi:MAG: hypothetical protein ACLTXH_16060 [Enterobacter hormaechei]